ncbi:IS66 family insertion sequence element accessory protein TnpB [Dyadobacter frigoris]|uniref:IS66 family insertion sequence element accessory protein TnpB n=1 Tax=Dyadobacter frigoris TaxID=2576211 RepID=UPI00255510DA|nr:IS66 family insertion sequence element accessory protein TnpB [Dyadobacter frigoris]
MDKITIVLTRCYLYHHQHVTFYTATRWICAAEGGVPHLYIGGPGAKGLKLNSFSADIFVFIGSLANQVRLLQWDGYPLYSKRLVAGTFERPLEKKLLISTRELMVILQGVKLKFVQLHKRCK